MTHIQLGS